MVIKLLFGTLGVLLMVAFLGPIVFKLKEVSLSIVLVIGLALMIIDMLQSLRGND